MYRSSEVPEENSSWFRKRGPSGAIIASFARNLCRRDKSRVLLTTEGEPDNGVELGSYDGVMVSKTVHRRACGGTVSRVLLVLLAGGYALHKEETQVRGQVWDRLTIMFILLHAQVEQRAFLRRAIVICGEEPTRILQPVACCAT